MYTEAVAVLGVDYLWAPFTLPLPPLIVYTNEIRLLSVCDVLFAKYGEILQILVMYSLID